MSARRRGKTKDAVLAALAESGGLTVLALLSECPHVPGANALWCCLRELRRQGLVRAEPYRGRALIYRRA